MTESEETEALLCGVCGIEIPAARLKAMPETQVCVKCSEEIGGEYELEVTITGVAKAGSLKKTGETVDATLKKKTFR